MHWSHTLTITIQANNNDDLLKSMDEVKKHIADGYALAHDESVTRRYAYNIEVEEEKE
jgi:hypothetical protein